MLTADDLLRGGQTTHEITLTAALLQTGEAGAARDDVAHDGASPDGVAQDGASVFEGGTVVIRPLVLADIQRIRKAGGDSGDLASVLMVQQALVEPALTVEQVNRLHAGLVQFLLTEVNRVSGLGVSEDELVDAVQAPMARACFTLSREFGWTPDECANLTLGQVLLYLEMIGKGEQCSATV